MNDMKKRLLEGVRTHTEKYGFPVKKKEDNKKNQKEKK